MRKEKILLFRDMRNDSSFRVDLFRGTDDELIEFLLGFVRNTILDLNWDEMEAFLALNGIAYPEDHEKLLQRVETLIDEKLVFEDGLAFIAFEQNYDEFPTREVYGDHLKKGDHTGLAGSGSAFVTATGGAIYKPQQDAPSFLFTISDVDAVSEQDAASFYDFVK